MLDRGFFEKLESDKLSPYAALSATSQGRRFPEPEHAFRTAYQRDRDRIIHCTAVPPVGVQDPGLRESRGRPLPHAAHSLPGGRPNLAHHRPGPSPQRRSDGKR